MDYEDDSVNPRCKPKTKQKHVADKGLKSVHLNKHDEIVKGTCPKTASNQTNSSVSMFQRIW